LFVEMETAGKCSLDKISSVCVLSVFSGKLLALAGLDASRAFVPPERLLIITRGSVMSSSG
jgi:hypothetical protein